MELFVDALHYTFINLIEKSMLFTNGNFTPELAPLLHKM